MTRHFSTAGNELSVHSCTPSESEWRTERDEADVPHVVPTIGPKHELSMQCWCHPVIDADRYDEPAVSHNVGH